MTEPQPTSMLAERITGAFRKMADETAAFAESLRPQMDALPQSKPCQNHQQIVVSLDRDETAWQTKQYREFRPAYGKCPLCVADDVAQMHRAFWRRRGVPDRVLHATFDNFEAIGIQAAGAISAVRDFVDRAKSPLNPSQSLIDLRGGFLLLVGRMGTGKGHLAVAAMKALGRGGRFITHLDLLTDLRASYSAGTTPAFLELHQEAECLILDEFGVSAGGKDEGPILYQILARRHDRRLPTIITSNETVPVISEILGFRLMDRIREDYRVVVMTGESYRRPAICG
jgi:DNA replication protein DnaC